MLFRSRLFDATCSWPCYSTRPFAPGNTTSKKWTQQIDHQVVLDKIDGVHQTRYQIKDGNARKLRRDRRTKLSILNKYCGRTKIISIRSVHGTSCYERSSRCKGGHHVVTITAAACREYRCIHPGSCILQLVTHVM